jgi:hypothetical protein
MREYLRYGLMQSSGYHIVTLFALIGFGAVGKATSISFVSRDFMALLQSHVDSRLVALSSLQFRTDLRGLSHSLFDSVDSEHNIPSESPIPAYLISSPYIYVFIRCAE